MGEIGVLDRSDKALWPRRLEDDPPDLACQVVVGFASSGDLERMLASTERQALRQRLMQARALFDGTLSHIDFEALDAPDAPTDIER